MALSRVLRIREPLPRERGADRVFRVLAADILEGELKPNELLPTESELADMFGVSRILVREALHRLMEYQLVLVHQGHRTVVLDPSRATSMHLLGLETQVASSDPGWMAAFAERQTHSAIGLLALAERHIEPQQVELLETITEQLAQVAVVDARADWLKYTRAYWMNIAITTKNRLCQRDTAWHFQVLERNPHLRERCTWPAEHRVAYHRRINGKLRERQGAAAAYLEIVRELRRGTRTTISSEMEKADSFAEARA